ncbi:hypothetical protein BC830DRAFT_1137794 [Chytriomyces sp. MP71]|nr:hypothetical protein BC830DRAFT_1137794 [Chytriomyces sp. MP71]
MLASVHCLLEIRREQQCARFGTAWRCLCRIGLLRSLYKEGPNPQVAELAIEDSRTFFNVNPGMNPTRFMENIRRIQDSQQPSTQVAHSIVAVESKTHSRRYHARPKTSPER